MKVPQTSNRFFSVLVALALVAGFWIPPAGIQAAGTVSLTSIGTAYTQDFDTLASSGTSSTVPTGWDFSESGTGANTIYTAGTGSSNSGDTYSFGASGNTERAFGGLLSGSVTPTIGAQFTNNTGSTITSLVIAYTGEMWRAGVTNRNAADRIDFQLSTDANGLTTGTWVDHDGLDFNSPNIAATAGALDGNLSGNRTALSLTISSLNIANGSSFWIRWADYNISSSDDGLSVDDFSLTPQGVVTDPAPTVDSTVPADNATSVAVDADIVINFSEAVDVTSSSFTIDCTTSGEHTFGLSGSGTSVVTLDPDNGIEEGEACTVTVVAANVSDSDTNDPEDLMAEDYVFSFITDEAPTVAGTTPINGATGVASNANITIDFSEAVNVPDSFFDIFCTVSSAHSAAVSGSGTSTITLNPNSDFTPGESCTVTVHAAQVSDADAGDPPDAMAADYAFSFTVSASTDNAPAVTGTAPVDKATGVAVDTDISIDFSEAVTFPDSFFDIFCDASGAHTAVVSGSGSNIATLNPNTDFNADETCTVTVHKDLVSDVDSDDPPDAMAADYAFSFTTDAAPSVTGTTPADQAVGVIAAADVVVNFSEDVNVTTASFGISCGNSGAHSFALSGSGASYTLNPDSDFSGGETCTVTVYAAQVSDSDAGDPPDQMAANYVFDFTITADACGGPITPIYTIQGSGDASPVAGSTVSTEGIVVGDLQGTSELKGIFIQDATGDGNAATSDGLFVYNATSLAVNVGDKVRVRGAISEYNGLTEMGTPNLFLVCSTGTSVSPVSVTLPETTNGEMERYEGMLVSFAGPFTVDQTYFLGRYGQMTLSVGGRMYNPTNNNGLGDTADYNARRMLVLDDGSSVQNPNPIPYYAADGAVRAGDTVGALTGLLDQGAINATTPYILDYRLHPTTTPVFTQVNLRTTTPEAVGGTLKVASFNVLNYFNGNGDGTGFPTSRGASTLLEFTRQRTKIIAALTAIDADVVGLMEIENDGTDSLSAVQDLVNGLNDATAAGTYTFVVEPAPGTDEIKVAMIYKPGSVTPVGSAENYQVASYLDYTPLYDRSPLIQTFEQNSNGQQFAVIVNHFKSKGSCPASGADADQGDGQGCWNAKRVAQAEKLVEYINTLKTTVASVLVIGDLNAYGGEDPIATLKTGGMVDEVASRVPAETRYTYVFDGQAGNLDQALATPALDSQISDTTIWHINPDEPVVIDYNTEYKTVDLYTPTPYMASDHDPVIVGLELKAVTTTSVATSGSPSTVGQTVTFTATVSAASGTPTGTVQFKDNSADLGSPVALVNGQASLSTAALAAGSHTITAEYSGDADYNVSTGTLNGGQTVNKLNVTVSLVSSPNPLVNGNTVTFTATVSLSSSALRLPSAPAACAMTGSVSFKEGSTILGSPVALDSNCQAVLAYSAFTPGSHTIVAEYSGDSTYNPAASSSLIQQVNQILYFPIVKR